MRKRRGRRGFTLMEVALATTIVGTGFVAMLALLAAGTRVTQEGAEQTSAVMLVRNIRERALAMTFDEVVAMNGTTFCPPVDSCGNQINTMPNWSQVVRVQPVDPNRLSLEQIDPNPSAVRVTVVVRQGPTMAETEDWYSFRPLVVP